MNDWIFPYELTASKHPGLKTQSVLSDDTWGKFLMKSM